MSSAEKCEQRRLEGWLRLLWAGAVPVEELQHTARRALQTLPQSARAYPLVLYVYGESQVPTEFLLSPLVYILIY